MAGEWLKFECSLPEKPETLAITVAMGWEDPDLTVGKLMRLFRWFDQQTVCGNAPNVTAALLDRIIGVTGFIKAVASVGWIVVDASGISLANFERHNGATAKSRALTAKRVANHRGNGEGNAESNAPNVTPALAREEKKREEIKEEEGSPPRKRAATLAIDGIPPELLADFETLRKAKKVGAFTPSAVKLLTREAEKSGLTLLQAIETCVQYGWAGFNATWYAERQAKPAAGGKQSFGDQRADVARSTVPGSNEPDPALLKIAAERAQAVPPSSAVRDRMRELSGRLTA